MELKEVVEEVLVEKQVPHKEVLELQALQILEEAEVVLKETKSFLITTEPEVEEVAVVNPLALVEQGMLLVVVLLVTEHLQMAVTEH